MKKIIILAMLLLMALPAFAMSPDECFKKYEDYIQIVKYEKFKGPVQLAITEFHYAIIKITTHTYDWEDVTIIERRIDKKPSAIMLSLETSLTKTYLAIIEFDDCKPTLAWKVKDIPEDVRPSIEKLIQRFSGCEM